VGWGGAVEGVGGASGLVLRAVEPVLVEPPRMHQVKLHSGHKLRTRQKAEHSAQGTAHRAQRTEHSTHRAHSAHSTQPHLIFMFAEGQQVDRPLGKLDAPCC